MPSIAIIISLQIRVSNEYDNTYVIKWRFGRDKHLRSANVTGTVSNEENGIDSGFLGESSCVFVKMLVS